MGGTPLVAATLFLAPVAGFRYLAPMTVPRNPVREWRDVTPAQFDATILPLAEPAVLRELVSDWPATLAGQRSPAELVEYLATHASGELLPTYVGSPSIEGRFFYGDDLRGFNFDRGTAPFAAVSAMLLAGIGDPAAPAIYSGAAAATDHFPTFAADNPMPLLDTAIMPRLWIGNATTVSTHYDNSTNIACVAAGTRRFTLFPPDQVSNLYVGPLENTISGQPVSMVDPVAPDLDRFPKYQRALEQSISVDLEPGDAILIPPLWWHHVRATSPFNLLVNYWWNAPADASAFDAMIHGMLAIRDLPANERTAWRAFFDHFVFDADVESVAHLPEHARGILGKASAWRTGMIHDFLVRNLSRARSLS